MRKKKGTYVIDGKFVGYKDPIEITVDSGAEDSVCPKAWGGTVWAKRTC